MSDLYLARFRANPAKLRVSVRRLALSTYLAVIVVRESGMGVGAVGRTAPRAVAKAFQLAERERLDGIDRDMSWAYDHPQGPLAPPDRVSRISEAEIRSTARPDG